MQSEAKHPIRVVARLTGLSTHVIRAWERRYQAVRPVRTETGRRLYTRQDIERLQLMKLAVQGGRRISDVAHLKFEELGTLVDGDRSSTTRPVPGAGSSGEAGEYLHQSLQALEQLDKDELEQVLKDAAIALGSQRLRVEVIVPLMHTVGERWREGSLRIIHEHLVSSVVASMLTTLRDGSAGSQSAPRIVVTTPAGEYHELGALLAASAAQDLGWDVVYLGSNLPAEEIVLAAREFRARAVGLSIVQPATHLDRELRHIREHLDPGVVLLVGGRAAGRLQSFLAELDVHYIEDLTAFQEALESLTL